MKLTMILILLTWPQFDQSVKEQQPEPILIAKVCPDGYECEQLKWGFYRITKD